ncbi:MAG: hypothetical protein HYZ73_07325 [Elusimicrobia bacterium]|nr:hypothetical protein [Elusimicrobiota bacterium]
MNSSRGQTSVIVLGTLVVLLVVIPSVVWLLQGDTKGAVRQTRTTKAFHLAEAGIDRGAWKLSESLQVWTDAKNGVPISGYTGTTEYTEVAGGSYKIAFSSGPGTGEVTVTAKGRDQSTNEIRTLQVIFERTAVNDPVQTGGTNQWQPNLTVHWGPVISYGQMTLSGGQTTTYWPHKIAKGAIDPWDTNPAAPNSDQTRNYEAFRTDLGSPPQLDLDDYRTQAQSSVVPDPGAIGGGSNGGQSAAWLGTGYFDGSGEVRFKSYQLNNSSAVIFVETGNVKIEDTNSNRSFLRVNALVVANGNIHIHAKGLASYTFPVPANAWQQYVSGTVVNPSSPDTSASNEYPGDNGYHTVSPTYTAPSALDPPGLTGVVFHGLLSTYQFHCAGGNNLIVGVAMVTTTMEVNTMVIYYDPAISDTIRLTSVTLKRKSWQEIVTTW